ncbi:hypothetical protein VF14_18450 [Nostoc linckia z18]|uniref:Phage terminase large subunit family protein n=2 Tax=Nostoc linckia TaxID=92942 RepID=A0A9Q5Z998_NOSLI|nr:phage terminase large subunit family protein [Nostoc linckia]PHJ81957.1 hypothetical protein VF07_29080 [Nostoc linckia z6]PHJ92855.1 hypothetical protein VF04_27795 [Nostoc linckia z7]PHK00822.1 hypothetical protein VF08_23450 [Nostoc linckia z8]PHK09359.1 hypothetical protein VF09_16225 [Nostoc linckia z9]PHK09568.1 hypothetical protein VF10_36165 [Nostoc linckia z13]
MLANAEDIYLEAFFGGFMPDPVTMTVSEWADNHRFLSSKSAAEPGQWETSRTPYLREIMDCLSATSPVQRIVFMKGAQVGGTECGNNWIGYVIDLAPGPFLMVNPSLDVVERTTKQRLDPMFAESPRLAAKVADKKSKDSSNTMKAKEFPGGLLMLTGANAPASLRSMPIRYLFMDEVDAYPGDVGKEGDPVELATARTRTYRRNRKILLVSTPTIKGHSRIETAFEESDQRYFYVPCPQCRHRQRLVFSNLKWEKGKPETAYYVCEGCGFPIDERLHKTIMLAQGSWVAHKPENTRARGYHLSSLYSPYGWMSWADIAEQFEQAKGKPSELKTFINTVLGETWNDKGEAPDHEALYRRREEYSFNTVPKGGLFLTAGADVQRDRIEVEVVAWGPNMESWSIDYRVLKGDTSQNEVWDRLKAMLHERWPHESGALMALRFLAVDSGDQTQTVYNWVRTVADERVMAIKGVDNMLTIFGQPKQVDINYQGQKIYRGCKYWPVGVSVVKTELYGFLRQKPPLEKDEALPYGFCHFPHYDMDYFKGITAEHRISKTVNGRPVLRWEKSYERNEPLDCRVYARAAAAVFGIDRFQEEQWQQLQQELAAQLKPLNNAPTKQERRVNPFTGRDKWI